jgi:aminoglycoside/choline kinase family phosphotransferase
VSVVEPYVEKFLEKTLSFKDIKILPLAGDASNRKYYRIVHSEESWVLMKWEPFNPEEYPFLSVLQHFAKNGVQVPKVVGMSPQEGLVLLEDLGDLTLERRFWENQNQETVMFFYKMALDEIIKIHGKATQNKSNCTAFKIQFDVEKLLWELNYGNDNLILGVLKADLTPKVQNELQKIFINICETLHKEPKVICHRDYHSRNLMIKLDKMFVIDFQDARMGPIQYDLVSLFRDSYVELEDNTVAQLMDYYLTQSKEFLPKNFSRAHFDEIYEIQSLQRCFKACGSFASFYHQRGDKRYLKYLTPTLKRVIKCLLQFPQYKLFSDILIDSGALEKKFETL